MKGDKPVFTASQQQNGIASFDMGCVGAVRKSMNFTLYLIILKVYP